MKTKWRYGLLLASAFIFTSCESPEEKAKRLACEELQALNIAENQYDAQLIEKSAKGNIKQMKLLLTAGADVNVSDSKGNTALMAAIKSGNPEAVNILLDAGANIHAQDTAGATALHHAAKEGNKSVVAILLEKNIDSSKADNTGKTALGYAVDGGHPNVVEQLVALGSEADAADAAGNTLLMHSAGQGNTNIMSVLLKAGAAVNAVNQHGESALHMSVEHAAATRLLLDAGAEINTVDNQGNTPLMLAVKQKSVAAVKLLLERRANMEVLCPGEIPLIALAADSGNAEIVKLLIEAGLNPAGTFQLNGNKVNALSCATSESVRRLLKEYGCLEIISTDEAVQLLERYEIITFYYEGDVERAEWGGLFGIKPHGSIAEEITYNYKLYKDGRRKLSQYGYVNAIYQIAKANKELPEECIISFIVAGSPVNEQTLEYAVKRGHVQVMKLLLDTLGIDVNAKINPGLFIEDKTLLHVAAENGCIEVVKALLATPGIDVNAKKRYGHTPLHEAAWNGHTEVVKILLDAPGIDVNAKSDEGYTPLNPPDLRGRVPEIIRELLTNAGGR